MARYNDRRKLRKGPAYAFAAVICILVLVVVVVAVNMRHVLSSNTLTKQSSKQVTSSASVSSGLSSSSVLSSASTSQTLESETALGGLLMLVNKEHPLPESYTPNFVTVPSKYYYSSDKDNNFDSRAAPYLEKFITDARAAGFDLDIVSGYRSYSYQQENYDRHVSSFLSSGYTSAAASSAAANEVAPPGTSEHETGLAADIITSDWYVHNKDLTASFDQTPAFAWMYAHCADYGFILRYLKNKVNVTGYEYEPWHYRFVGVDNAKKIMQSGLCLEEYLNKIQK
jgi:D-alanyl-D-alanine carboxypeptidase